MNPSPDSLHDGVSSFYESYSLPEKDISALQQWGSEMGHLSYTSLEQRQLERARRYRWVVLWLGLMCFLVITGVLLQRNALRYANAAQHRTMWQPLLSWHQESPDEYLRTHSMQELKHLWPHLSFRPIASVHMPHRIWKMVGSAVLRWKNSPVLMVSYIRRSDGVKATLFQQIISPKTRGYNLVMRRLNASTVLKSWHESGLFVVRIAPPQ